MNYLMTKSDPKEEINIKDLIITDIETGKVTKSDGSTLENYEKNANLVLGVCVDSDNETELPEEINCGGAKDEQEDVLLDLGDSTTETIHILYCDNSFINPRTLIEVQVNGITRVYLDDYEEEPIEIGKQLIMGKEIGRARINELDGREFSHYKSFGKIIDILDDNEVEILLDVQ